ncbi:hypothetical protein [uncultured Maribacter sp.]|uniref:hypothetical protein n=1 Tax=uncultured Maribacter sp. TaxID=431308 RepID=UPI0026287E94|nr:hypothetical protein [uncultured Maribacter sp.]
MLRIISFLFIVLFLLSGAIHAQEAYLKNALQSIDQAIGLENTELYNGTMYVEYYRTINENHKFFESKDFLTGSIVYGNQYYNNVPFKYDLDTDDILLDISHLKKFPVLKLYRNRLSEFSLNGKNFINIGDNASKITKGFHEVLWSSDDIKFLKKHKKEKLKRYSTKFVHYEFFDDSSYFFEYNNQIHPLNKKGDLLNVFPEFRKEINDLYNKRLVKINPKENYILIFGELQKSIEK